MMSSRKPFTRHQWTKTCLGAGCYADSNCETACRNMPDNVDDDDGPYAFSDYIPPCLFPTDSQPNPHEDTGQPHIEVNPLVASTMGLEALHSRIRHLSLDAASCGTSHSAQGHATREARLAAVWCGGPGGRLRIGAGTSMELAALPLLGRRYRALRLLGEGTFAQILECEDTLAPVRHQTSGYAADYGRHFSEAHGVAGSSTSSVSRRVAVKVLRAGFAELGRREARALAAIQFSRGVCANFSGSSGSSNSSSSDAAGEENELWSVGGSNSSIGLPVLGLRGTFRFLGHFAVVLDLAAGSLLDVAFGGYPLGGYTRTPWRVVDPSAGIFPPPPTSTTGANNTVAVQELNFSTSGHRDITQGSMSSCSNGNGSSGGSTKLSFTGREQWDARVQARKSSRALPPQAPHTPAHVMLAVAAHLLTALARLKALGIVHADLKPENVLLVPTASAVDAHRQSESVGSDTGSGFGAPAGLCDGFPFVPVLADFGNALHAGTEGPLYEQTSAAAANTTATTNTIDKTAADHASTDDHCTAASELSFECQTLAYRAPEVLLGLPGAVACAADAWSLGVLLAELWLGLPLFRQAAEAAEEEDRNHAMAPPMPPQSTTSVGTTSSSSNDLRNGSSDHDTGELTKRARRARRARALMVCDIEALLGPLHRSTFKHGKFYASVFREDEMKSTAFREDHEGKNNSGVEIGAGDGRHEDSDDNETGSGLDVGMSSVHRRSLRHVKRVSELLRTKQGPAPPLLVSLLSGLLCPDPQQRLTPLQALHHPALQSLGGGCAVPYAALAAAERTKAAILAASANQNAMVAAAAALHQDTRSSRRRKQTATEAATSANAEEITLPVTSGRVLNRTASDVGADNANSPNVRRRQSSGRIKLVRRHEREVATGAEFTKEAAVIACQATAGELELHPKATDAKMTLEKADAVSTVDAAIPRPVLSSACSPTPSASASSVDSGLARSPSRQSRIKLVRRTDRASDRASDAVDDTADAIPAAPPPEDARRVIPQCNVKSTAGGGAAVGTPETHLTTIDDETESDEERIESSTTIYNVDDSEDDANDGCDNQSTREVKHNASRGKNLRSIRSNGIDKKSKDSSESVLSGIGARSKRTDSSRTQTSSSRREERDSLAAPNGLMSLFDGNYEREFSDSSSEVDSDSADGGNDYDCVQKKTDNSDQACPRRSSQGNNGLLEQAAIAFEPSVGSYVMVAPRSGPGENHPGGVALVTAVHRITMPSSRDSVSDHGSSTVTAANEPAMVVDVRYVLSRRPEARLPLSLLKAHDPLANTPKRQRLRPNLSNTDANESTSSEMTSSTVDLPWSKSSDRRDNSSNWSRAEGTIPLSSTPTPLPLTTTAAIAAVHSLVDSPVTDSRTKRRRLLRESSDSKPGHMNSSSSNCVVSSSISSRADAAWGGHALSPSAAQRNNGLTLGRSTYGSPSH